MATQSIPVLKETFSDNKEPNGQDFGNLIDSFEHKSIPIAQSRILGLNQTLDKKADKDQLSAIIDGIVRQPAVDTYNDTSGGKTSLLATYPNPEIGWDVLVREENTRYSWNGEKWVNLETGVYNDEDLVRKEDIQNEINDSQNPISSSTVKKAVVIGGKQDITGTKVGGAYVLNNGSFAASADYERSGFIKVTAGETVFITACLAYNATTPNNNACIAGYSAENANSFVKTVLTLPDVGITTAGRNVVENRPVIIPSGVNYIVGSSAFQNSGDKNRNLQIVRENGEMFISEVVPQLEVQVESLVQENVIISPYSLPETDIEQGTFDSNNGNALAANNRIRTNKSYAITRLSVKKINTGYQYIIWKYKNGAYVEHSGWQTALVDWDLTDITEVKFAFSKPDGSNISPSDYEAIGFIIEGKTTLKRAVENIIENGGGGSTTVSSDVITRNKEAEKAVLACRKKFLSFNNANETSFALFAHTSDLHQDPTRLANFIKYCEYIGVDAGFVTGDIVSLYFTDDFTYYQNQVLKTKIPMFNTIGNHEAQNGGTDEALQAKFFTPLEVQNGATSEGKGYYYRDFVAKKIRIIGLNQFQQGGATRERRYLKPDQITWLINTLKSTPSGYGVVLLTHVPEHAWSKDPDYPKFWQDKMLFTDMFSNITGSPIADIVDAFISKTTINKTYTQNGALTSLSVNGDFSTVNSGVEFIAYANGHLHGDFIGYLNDTVNKQLVLNIVCGNAFTGSYRDGLSDLPRQSGTVCEDAFNIYGIDRDLKAVKVARVGSNVNYKMEDRNFMIIPYK